MNSIMVMEDRKQRDLEDLVARYVASPRPELKDLIMVEFTGLVERIARRYAGIEPVADLVQVGFIGLLNALSKYDPSSSAKFGTYAQHLVTGEIKHYLRDRSQTIRQPAWLQELRHKVNRASGAMFQTCGRQPTAAEIAAELGVSESSVKDVLETQDMLRVTSLDAPSDDESGHDLDRIEVSELCHEQSGLEDRLMLESAIGQLRELERQVLVHFHFDSMSQAEIARRCGISTNYVSHILRQSLAKLRRILEEDEAKETVLRKDAIDAEVFDRSTGAYTESYLRTRLREELHRNASQESELAILVLEIRGSDQMARTYGPDSISALLTDVSEVLRSNVRRLDLVGRYGPTGFAILLPHAGPNVVTVRDRLTSKLASWLASRQRNLNLEFCFGQAWAPRDSQTAGGLLATASSKVEESSSPFAL